MTSNLFLSDLHFLCVRVQKDSQSSFVFCQSFAKCCQNTSQTRLSRDTEINNESFITHTNKKQLKIWEEKQEV